MAWSDQAREAALLIRRMRKMGKPWKPRIKVGLTPAQRNELSLWSDDRPAASFGMKIRGKHVVVRQWKREQLHGYLMDDYDDFHGITGAVGPSTMRSMRSLAKKIGRK